MALTLEDVIDVLQKCMGYAPDKTPANSELVIAAWFKHFSDPSLASSRVCREEALYAVDKYFQQPRDSLVQPSDISTIARQMRRDFNERNVEVTGTDEERRRRKLAWERYLDTLRGNSGRTALG